MNNTAHHQFTKVALKNTIEYTRIVDIKRLQFIEKI